MNRFWQRSILALALALLPISLFALSESDSKILSDLETVLASNKSDLCEQLSPILEAGGSAELRAIMISRIEDAKSSDKRRAIYAWALGLCKSQEAVAPLIKAYKKSLASASSSEGAADSQLFRDNCIRAFSNIGGSTASDFTCSLLKSTSGKTERFHLLLCLCKLRKNVPELGELLLVSPDEQWKPMIAFGEMGMPATSFLVSKIFDKALVVRINAINSLMALVPPDFPAALRAQCLVENDETAKGMMLNAMFCSEPDLKILESFLKDALSKEQNKNLKSFLEKLLAAIPQLESGLKNVRAEKKPSAADFQKAYDAALKSKGKNCDYESLAKSSSFEDEAKLVNLRKQIFLRESDEALFDAMKINGMIITNRRLNLLAAGAASSASSKSDSPKTGF